MSLQCDVEAILSYQIVYHRFKALTHGGIVPTFSQDTSKEIGAKKVATKLGRDRRESVVFGDNQENAVSQISGGVQQKS